MAMNLIRERPTPLTIKSYNHQGFRIGERLFTGAIALTWEGLLDSWQAPAPELLTPADLDPLVSVKPDLILLGGGGLSPVAPAVIAALQKMDLGCEIMSTAAACRTWNLLLSEGRQVAAALWPA